MIDLCYLKVGMLVRVRYGSSGSQAAIVTKEPGYLGGTLKVRKYRVNSRAWTKPIQIGYAEVLIGLPASALTPEMRAALDRARASAVGTHEIPMASAAGPEVIL